MYMYICYITTPTIYYSNRTHTLCSTHAIVYNYLCTLHTLIVRSVVIHNRSDVVVHYEWKAFATEEDEQTEKEM